MQTAPLTTAVKLNSPQRVQKCAGARLCVCNRECFCWKGVDSTRTRVIGFLHDGETCTCKRSNSVNLASKGHKRDGVSQRLSRNYNPFHRRLHTDKQQQKKRRMSGKKAKTRARVTRVEDEPDEGSYDPERNNVRFRDRHDYRGPRPSYRAKPRRRVFVLVDLACPDTR